MRALILIDLQYDFMPGGALGVAEGDQVVQEGKDNEESTLMRETNEEMVETSDIVADPRSSTETVEEGFGLRKAKFRPGFHQFAPLFQGRSATIGTFNSRRHRMSQSHFDFLASKLSRTACPVPKRRSKAVNCDVCVPHPL